MKTHFFTKLLVCSLTMSAAVTGAANAALLFSENFNYTIGSNLAGQGGATNGFAGAWSGGNSTIVAGLGGTGNAVQIGASIASRSLSTNYSTSGNTFYISYLMNVSDFSGGNYTGISLWDGGSEQEFFGIPWQTQNFGFDARGGSPNDIKSVNFSPSINTTYLVTFGLLPSATSGKVDLKMWATSNLGIDPNTLVSGAANAELLGTRNNFSFNTLTLNGDYSGNLKVSGIANAPTAAEAINFSTQSAAPVPEPGTWAAAALLAGGAAYARWRKRRDEAQKETA